MIASKRFQSTPYFPTGNIALLLLDSLYLALISASLYGVFETGALDTVKHFSYFQGVSVRETVNRKSTFQISYY